MYERLLQSCTLCGGSEFAYLVTTPSPVHVVFTCKECQLSVAVPVEGGFRVKYGPDYYKGDTAYVDYTGAADVHRRHFRNLVAWIRTFKPDGRLLDVGCAAGYLLEEAVPFFDVVGIDIAENFRERADPRFDIRSTSIEESGFDEASFDVVVLANVLEHLRDPLSTFREIRRVLAPGGVVVFTAPDTQSVVARILGRRWRYVSPYHLHYYGRASILRLLHASGLEAVEMGYRWKYVSLKEALYTQLHLVDRSHVLERYVRLLPTQLALPLNLADVLTVVARVRME